MSLGAHGAFDDASADGMSSSAATTNGTLIGKIIHSMELLLTGSEAQLAFTKHMVMYCLRQVLPNNATIGSTMQGTTLLVTEMTRVDHSFSSPVRETGVDHVLFTA